MRVDVVPYDPAWPAAFEAERTVLADALGPWLSAGVHHIGSTSVPGLAAKPILDMLAGVADLDEASAAIAPLQQLGYVHAPHRPRALWFFRPSRDAQTHALHLTEPGSDLSEERLTFRDALRADASLTAEYAALKQQLAHEHPDDLAAYTQRKRGFVALVLAEHGVVLQDPHRRT